jgi:hypothetical protein
VEHTAVTPSIFGGLKASLRRRLRFGGATEDDLLIVSLGLEVLGTWVTQRDRSQDFVQTMRVFLSLGGMGR